MYDIHVIMHRLIILTDNNHLAAHITGQWDE